MLFLYNNRLLLVIVTIFWLKSSCNYPFFNPSIVFSFIIYLFIGYNFRSQIILTNLKLYLESNTVEDKEAPVRACYRYIDNRPNYLDYKGAIENGLLVGPGETESAHRQYLSKQTKDNWFLVERRLTVVIC